MYLKQVVVLAVLATLFSPVVAAARDDVPRKRWSVGLRLGSFSTSHDVPWNRNPVRAAGGLEVTHYNSSLSALSLTFDGQAFAGHYIALVPITVSYKVFPWNNGTLPARYDTGGPIRPWIGAGIGLYVHELDWWENSTVAFGAHGAGNTVEKIGEKCPMAVVGIHPQDQSQRAHPPGADRLGVAERHIAHRPRLVAHLQSRALGNIGIAVKGPRNRAL